MVCLFAAVDGASSGQSLLTTLCVRDIRCLNTSGHAAAVQELRETSNIFFPVRLSAATATQPDDVLQVQDPLNITLVYPTEGEYV